MTTADERWTRRIMGGLGVRPVGHADPSEADGPQIPEQSPVPPPATPPSQPRVPDWWRVARPPLAAVPDPNEPDDDSGHDSDDQDDDEHQEQDDQPQEHKPDPARPATPPTPPGPPVAKVATGGPKRTGVRKLADSAADDRTTRWVVFNGTAAAVGYGIGLVPFLEAFMPAAEQGAVGMLSLFTAAVGGYGAWLVSGFPAVKNVLPHPPVSRLIITVGAAEIGRRFAPVPVDWLNANGERWGLGPSAVSLLLTAGSMCGGLWWFIDRRTRNWHWAARWIVRIPLASAVLATGLYAPGTTS
ncbi:hypothetical protein DI272_18995 [Streptomyces sp. Act143]|uniref:hypothetical protein n=1 Tax=Streptomyces sp. Act143 TaxID=2200760 RepID=UPI000D674FEB|nr:hypothetical protein [Streptomyces sp. Act143]PWI16021.1 hypothetical protein DI272_18995 [Streptomyces sp. Act143]